MNRGSPLYSDRPGHSGLSHTTPEEFEKGGFTLKAHQMFYVHTTPEEFKNATITGHFGFGFEETSGREITCDAIVFEKLRFQNVFRLHENEKSTFSNCSGLKSVFEIKSSVFVTD